MATTRKKLVYFFGGGKAEGRGDQKDLLGGKGAGLAEMTRIGLPVPAGFTLTTEVCDLYYRNGRRFPKGLREEVARHLARLERTTGKRLGDPADPLLVSVRSGAARSMPGMMETILNLGLNDVSVEGLARKTANARFACDAYRRFIQMYATIAKGLPRERFVVAHEEAKARAGVKNDPDLSEADLRRLVARFLDIYREAAGTPFPQDPTEQLWGAIEAVFGSWMAEKAVTYRRVERITGLKGTAVNIVQMVFGNKGETSGTGVCFTRDPSTGENVFFGDFLPNAQGEDVVAGIRTPLPLSNMRRLMPGVYRQLVRIRALLERHYRDMQDIEFTVEEGRLYILQCRAGKRAPAAAFRIAVDMARAGLIDRAEACRRVTPADVERLFHPVVDPHVPPETRRKAFLARGINAVPGAAAGRIAFTAAEAERRAAAGEKVILVRRETSPEDVGGMHAAQGILTSTGGKTSHAAVVARGWGKCCIVGCEAIAIDAEKREMRAGGRTLREGDVVTLDGADGAVYVGDLPLTQPTLSPAYTTLMKWADGFRRLAVRANADTPADARRAVEMGAEGIGLCRTEHMFFESEERRFAIQEMILADDARARRRALERLLPFQRADFEGIFAAMGGRPVTVRLIDPPLHEFVPREPDKQAALAARLGLTPARVRARVEQLHETNPMLGHRGCRLSITYPEILETQVEAILAAAVACRGRGIRVLPEIMHPLVMDEREFAILEEATRRVAEAVFAKTGRRVPYQVGTMIEIPRAALRAGAIAARAEFFSFGTNDLTQMTMGLSRDDAGRFLPHYVSESGDGIFAADPFQTLDAAGVGELVRLAIARGRAARPSLKIGICGEHGGDPASVVFCHDAGMDYVSCSPFRLPVARLAAAQAALARKERRT